MVDAQETHDDEVEEEEVFEDPQRDFASPLGSQVGEPQDLLGEPARVLLTYIHSHARQPGTSTFELCCAADHADSQLLP